MRAQGFWFAPLSPDTGEFDLDLSKVGANRHTLARRNLKAWLAKVGLPYHSPHKFRHGHVQYGLANSITVADFKAVSMNAMHSSIKITDEFYSILKDNEVRDRISGLGDGVKEERTEQGTLEQFKEFLAWKKSLKN